MIDFDLDVRLVLVCDACPDEDGKASNVSRLGDGDDQHYSDLNELFKHALDCGWRNIGGPEDWVCGECDTVPGR